MGLRTGRTESWNSDVAQKDMLLFIQQLGDRWGQKNRRSVNKKEGEVARNFSSLSKVICNAVNSLEKVIYK
jgi:hypothetical protein